VVRAEQRVGDTHTEGGRQKTTLRSGYGFAVLVPNGDALALEFYDAASDEALYVTSIRR